MKVEEQLIVYIGKDPGYKNAGSVFPFVKNIISYCEERNIKYTFNENERTDIALSIQWEPPLKTVEKLKRKGVKIVHRLDGRAKSVVKIYNKDNENRKISRLADWTVFQSNYVKEHTTKPVKTIFGVESPICQNVNRSSIIYNGVDRTIFNESGDKIPLKGKYNILHVAFTFGIRKGTKYLVRIAELLKNNPEYHFFLIGRQEQDLIAGHLIKKYKNITALGVMLDREVLARYMRSSQILLFPSEYDYCPNTVLEAMSCGLPVWYHDSGGTPELVRGGDYKAGVPLHEANPIYPLYVLIENLEEFKANAIANVKQRFTLDIMGDAYFNLFRSLMRS